MAVKKIQKKRTKTTLYYEAIGRRKEATCRVRLYIGKGEFIVLKDNKYKRGSIVVNNKQAELYFPGVILERRYMKPFELTKTTNRFVVSAHITGGGQGGQIDSFILASARALEKADKSFRSILKKQGLLTVDSRVKERRKAGLAQKARKEKQSPKR